MATLNATYEWATCILKDRTHLEGAWVVCIQMYSSLCRGVNVSWAALRDRWITLVFINRVCH